MEVDQAGFKLVMNCVMDFAVNACGPGDKLEVDVEWDSNENFKPIYLTWTMKGYDPEKVKEEDEKRRKRKALKLLEDQKKKKNSKRRR